MTRIVYLGMGERCRENVVDAVEALFLDFLPPKRRGHGKTRGGIEWTKHPLSPAALVITVFPGSGTGK